MAVRVVKQVGFMDYGDSFPKLVIDSLYTQIFPQISTVINTLTLSPTHSHTLMQNTFTHTHTLTHTHTPRGTGSWKKL